MKKLIYLLVIIVVMVSTQSLAQTESTSNEFDPEAVYETAEKPIVIGYKLDLKKIRNNVSIPAKNKFKLILVGRTYSYKNKIYFKILNLENKYTYFCKTTEELNIIESKKINFRGSLLEMIKKYF